jgi:hypothetical protein
MVMGLFVFMVWFLCGCYFGDDGLFASRCHRRQREEKGCGWVWMLAPSRGLHRTGADDGLEKPAIGEFRKPPPWCLSGTRALPRKNPAHRASPGNSPEKNSQEDRRENDKVEIEVEENI